MKSNDPKRALQWKGKSLSNCSKKELIACIIELVRQLSIKNTIQKEKE